MKQYKDKGLVERMDALFRLVYKEDNRQISKWGYHTHTLTEWLSFVTGDLGELAKAISGNGEETEDGKEVIVKEAIRVATLSLKIAKMVSEEA